jgi:hypothetical protein
MRRGWLFIALLALGCATRPTPPPGPSPSAAKRDYPGRLVPTETLARDFRAFAVRQRLTASHDGRSLPSLEAVLQLHGGVLRLVGLGPMGMRAFVITQKGVEIEAEAQMKEAAALHPRDVLNDIHRVFFRGLFTGSAAKPPPDGEHTGNDDGEVITETWRQGHLVRRIYTRPDQPGRIIIDFLGPGAVVAETVVIDNGWFGYQLRIVTLEQQWLPPSQ